MVYVREEAGRVRTTRRGASAVELVLVTPVMLMVMLGCIDFGRFPSTAIAVRNGARVGAEFARTQPSLPKTAVSWQARMKQVVVEEMSGLVGFDARNLTVGATRTELGGGRALVRVEVSYPFQTLVPWDYPGLSIPSRFTVSHQVVMEADGGL